MLLALDRENPVFMKLAAAAFKSRRPISVKETCKPATLEQSDLTGDFAKVTGTGAKLLTPEVFNFNAFTKLIDDMVSEGSIVRTTDSDVAGYVAPPRKPSEPKVTSPEAGAASEAPKPAKTSKPRVSKPRTTNEEKNKD
jgi:hypothetical protein